MDSTEEYYTKEKESDASFKRRFLPLAKEIANLSFEDGVDVQIRVTRALGQLLFMVHVHSAVEKRRPVEMYREYMDMILWPAFQAWSVLGTVYGGEYLRRKRRNRN